MRSTWQNCMISELWMLQLACSTDPWQRSDGWDFLTFLWVSVWTLACWFCTTPWPPITACFLYFINFKKETYQFNRKVNLVLESTCFSAILLLDLQNWIIVNNCCPSILETQLKLLVCLSSSQWIWKDKRKKKKKKVVADFLTSLNLCHSSHQRWIWRAKGLHFSLHHFIPEWKLEAGV